MTDDINELDVTDAGLKAVMGNRFHDETQNLTKQEADIARCFEKAYGNKNTTQKAKDKPVEAQWEPVKEPNWMDKLKDTAKWVIGFGGLSFLLFYWEQAGLMAESVAVPCMCLCTALAGVGIGKYAR